MKNIILATLTLAALAVTAPLVQADTNGSNVSSVIYVDPGTGQDVQINMNPNDRTHWQEHSPNGPFNFKAAARDEWSVFLWDADRNMAMQIDLHTKTITYGGGSPNGQVTQVIGKYPIKAAQ